MPELVQATIFDNLVKTYSNKKYVHTTIVQHKGTVVAFAMDDSRHIFYAVLDLSNSTETVFDSVHWPEDPIQLAFPTEIEQVGYSTVGSTALPLVKNGSREEAKPGILLLEEVDPFLSTTARFTDNSPFRVFSDGKFIFLFRQAIGKDHEDAIYKLKSGASSANTELSDELYVMSDGKKVPIVNKTLLCDRFNLSGNVLLPTREIRYQRSRHKSKPSGPTDGLAAKDMNGNPFYLPTQELAFINDLDGCFDVLQVPTVISGVKRWQIFAKKAATGHVNCYNCEVSGEGLFNLAGTQLYTSPDEKYRTSVLERSPGECPFTNLPLIALENEGDDGKTSIYLPEAGGYATGTGDTWTTSSFTIECWLRADRPNLEKGTGVFSSHTGSGSDLLLIDCENGKYRVKLGSTTFYIGPIHTGWQYISISYDGSSIMGMLGGTIVATVDLADTNVKFEKFIVGSNPSANLHFKGSMDELRIWDRECSETEIMNNHRMRLVGNELGLKHYYRFDEGMGMLAFDQCEATCELQLKDSATWVGTGCPISDNVSMRRNIFSIDKVTISGGLSATLYYQQEKAESGYNRISKPMKRQARVLLAMGSKSTVDDESAISCLDFSISRSGRLAQVPGVVSLPKLAKPEMTSDIAAIGDLEKDLESKKKQLKYDEEQIPVYESYSRSKDFFWQQYNQIERSDYQRNLFFQLQDAYKDFTNFWCEIKTPGDKFFGVPDAAKVQILDHPELFRFIQSGDSWMIQHKKTAHYLYRKSGTDIETRSKSDEATKWFIKKESDESFKIYSGGANYYLSASEFSFSLASESNASVYTVIKRDTSNDNIRKIQDELNEWNQYVSEVWAEFHKAVNAPKNLAAARTRIVKLTNEIAVISEKLGQLTSGESAPIRVPMKLIHCDSSGLNIMGGFLQFANTHSSPFITESAEGRLNMYFHESAGDGQLKSTFLDTSVSRAKFIVSPTLMFVARSAGPEAVDSISVSYGSSPDLCTLTFKDSHRGVTETWKEVPRIPSEILDIVNGNIEHPEYVTVTVDPPMYDVDKRSSMIHAVMNEDSATDEEPIEDGDAEIIPGTSSAWAGDFPGKALKFTTATKPCFINGNDDIAKRLLPDRELTIEFWMQPETGQKKYANIISNVAKNWTYSVHLEMVKSTDKTEHNLIAAVSQGNGSSWNVTRGLKNIPTGQWNHIAMTFKQSYALSFKGQEYVSCGNNANLNLTSDLSIEISLKLSKSEKKMGLLGKGRMSDNDKSVPYQVMIDSDNKILFLFEDESGKRHSFKSTKTIEMNAFQRIAVTRKSGKKTKNLRSNEQIYRMNQSGEESNVDVDLSRSIAVENFSIISFYVNGEVGGVSEYNGTLPTGHDGDFNIGRCFDSPSSAMYTVGSICEVRMWNVARAEKEIHTDIQSSEPGLVGWWQMNEGEGNVAIDSKSGSHGKLQNVSWIRSPDRTASPISLYFNGVPMTTKPESGQGPDWLHSGFKFCGNAQKWNQDEQPFVGFIDEVRIWRTVRTEEQIVDNLFTRLKGDKGDLLLYFPLDEEAELERTVIKDKSLLENHLPIVGTGEEACRTAFSTAPIGSETAGIRSALSGIKNEFDRVGDCAPVAAEYADMYRDARGNLGGVLKRCYGYLIDGQWMLVTGYKVGNLVTEWIGQAQFDPQITGFVEGAPPIPSENLVKGIVASADNASTVELVESDEVSYTVGTSKDGSCDAAFSAAASFSAGSDDMMVVAPFGFGVAKQVTDIAIDIGAKGNFDVSQCWSQEESQGRSVNKTQAVKVVTGGGFESGDPAHQLNPAVGRRAVPGNMGFAVMQSSTADIFALRLEHNYALVSHRMLPNPDIPRDWNIVPFPINPRYVKQGTLDGRVGYNEKGEFVLDPDYEGSRSYGEYSFYKPREAYALERNIRRQEQQRMAYYEEQSVGGKPGAMYGMIGMAATAAAATLIPGVGPSLASAAISDSLATVKDTASPLENRFGKRDLVNTYVWTAEGGFFSETTETTDVHTEESTGSFSFNGAVSGTYGTDVEIFSFGLDLEFEASAGGGMSVTKTKSKEASKSFELNVEIDVPGHLQKYDVNEKGYYVAQYDDEGKAIGIPGKVDAYRFKTFYLDSRKENFEDLYGKVIDPIWLAESDHPTAIAMREARQTERKPGCWRILHRVTFVSRMLPKVKHVGTEAAFEQAMQAESLESNWQLVKKLDPIVRSKIGDLRQFKLAVANAIQKYVPELVPHTKEVTEFMKLYYGIIE